MDHNHDGDDDDGDDDDDDDGDDDDDDDGEPSPTHTPLSTKPSFLSHSEEKDGNSQNWRTSLCVLDLFKPPATQHLGEPLVPC